MIMARGSSILLLMLFVSTGLLHSAFSVTHIVGGDKGWTMRNISLTFYDDWAAKQTFKVDDKLLFVYAQSTHNVWVVTVEESASCDMSNSVEHYEDANATVDLYRSGDYAFVCQYPGHCAGGMKMSLTVAASAPVSGPASSPAPSDEIPPAAEVPSPEEVIPEEPPTDSTPPSPPSAASFLLPLPALVAGGLFACVVHLLM